jgi:hypothetical protein
MNLGWVKDDRAYPHQHQVTCSVDLVQSRLCAVFLSGPKHYLLASGLEYVQLNCGSLKLDSGDERSTTDLQTVVWIAPQEGIQPHLLLAGSPSMVCELFPTIKNSLKTYVFHMYLTQCNKPPYSLRSLPFHHPQWIIEDFMGCCICS